VERVLVAAKRHELRSYQCEALRAWCGAGGKGVVVLPTGAGKTRVALALISALERNVLVLVPTRVLLHQWREALKSMGHGQSGQWGDGILQTKAVTVSTYHAALLHMPTYGNVFHLVVVDEAHHFSARKYSLLMTQTTAPLVLGLTATPPTKEDGTPLWETCGSIVFEKKPSEIRDHLAQFRRFIVRVAVPSNLAQEFQTGQRACWEVLNALGTSAESKDFAKLSARLRQDRSLARKWLVWLSARDAMARWDGLVAATCRFLAQQRPARCVVFAESTPMAVSLSAALRSPCFVTGVDATERSWALKAFREGRVTCIVSCRVLNEGFDLPGVDACILVGSTRSETEYIQRLGRTLRKHGESSVTLVEIFPDLPSSEKAAMKRSRWIAERFQ
jgi:superfamily II DNA or RNA helicase